MVKSEAAKGSACSMQAEKLKKAAQILAETVKEVKLAPCAEEKKEEIVENL